MVTARSASCTEMRCSGAATRPLGVHRLTAHQAKVRGAAGPIGRSECSDSGMPRRSTESLRTIVSARALPRPWALYLSANPTG